MAAPIARLHVSVFDLHLWKSPLNKKTLKDDLQFLADPAKYATFQAAETAVELANLRAFPLTVRSDRSRFWLRYATLAVNGSGNVGHWLVPLRCRPKNLQLSFDVRSPNLAAKTFATIWLWPFGWASQLEFAVRAPLDFSDVQTITQALREKKDPLPYVLADNRKSLSAVFSHLAGIVLQDVCAAGKSPGEDLMLTKHINVTLVPSKEMPIQRYGSIPPSLPRWSDAERSRFHAALLGKNVTVLDLLKREKDSVFMLTQLDGGNFGLTYFEEGTLLILGPASNWREKGRCLARNVSNVSLAAFALQKFVARRDQVAKDKPKLEKLAQAASVLLDDLATGRYSNAFSRKLLEMNGPVRRARAVGG